MSIAKFVEYKNNIRREIRQNPNMNRTELRNLCKKEYIYLYRYDKEWLFSNLPELITDKNIDNRRVDWGKRDLDYVDLIRNKYDELMLARPPIRITKGYLAKPLGILVNVEKKLDNLPNTKKLLDEIYETVEEFQIRRCKIIIDHFKKEGLEIKLWKVQKEAAIRTETFEMFKGKLEKYISTLI